MIYNVETEQEIKENRYVAILCYVMFFIPLLARPKSQFIRFHANQGLSLLLVIIAKSVLEFVFVFGLTFLFSTIYSTIGISGAYLPVSFVGIYKVLEFFINCCIFSWFVIGVINVIQNRQDELPIIGKYKLLDKISFFKKSE